MENQKPLTLDYHDISAIHPPLEEEMHCYVPKYSYLNLNKRLEENRERRQIIEIQKEKLKQNVLQRRRQKEDLASKILNAKQIARENSKQIFESCRKSTTDLQMKKQKKFQQIEDKISQTRNRAKQFKTHYQQSMRKRMEEKEKKVQERKLKQEKAESQKSKEFHLREWKAHEKKILQKYKGKIEKKNLYEGFLKKEKEISKLIQKYKIEKENAMKIQSQNTINEKSERKVRDFSCQRKNIRKVVTQKRKETTPIQSSISLTTFGLSRSFKNSDQVLNKLLKFVQNKRSVESPTKDKGLLQKLEFELGQLEDELS